MLSRTAPRVTPGSSPGAGTGHTSRPTGNAQYAADFSDPPRGTKQATITQTDSDPLCPYRPKETSEPRVIRASPNPPTREVRLQSTTKAKRVKDARRSVPMNVCVPKRCAGCRNELQQCRSAQEVHNCSKDKTTTGPMPVRGVHAARRDATVRGPRSPASRGAALERPILLEVSSKRPHLGDFGPRTRTGRHRPGPGRTATQHTRQWSGAALHTAHPTAPDER